jgi:environmental stress-induced protein Ves
MTPRIVALADVPPAPWKNGGGVTRELLARPPGSDWQVRISVAEIAADGPFSSFPGVARWFAVLEGGGVALTIDGVERRCRPGDAPVAFSGSAKVDCRLLDGPSRDLNLMLRGGAGAMVPAVAGVAWTAPRAGRCGLYALVAGRCVGAAGRAPLPDACLAWFDDAPGSLTFEPDEASPDRRVPAFWLAADAGAPSA